MKIHSINISEFAGLGQRSYDLSGGLNIIEGKNESGKSSILAFIKFILYGFSRRAAGEELGERDRFISWDGKRAAGSVTLSAGGRLWRVERELFMQTRGARESPIENCKIIDAETGIQTHAGEVPGLLFLGIPAEVFSSTCGVAQSSLSLINSSEVGSSIENLLFSADESLNAKRALEKLAAARRSLLHKNEKSGRLVDMRSERNILRTRLSVATTAAKNIIAKEALAAEYKRRADEGRQALEELEARWEVSELNLALGKFDELRRLEKKRADYSAALKELEEESFPSGFMPDRQYVSRLGALFGELTSAESELSRAEAELYKLESVPTYDVEKAKTAALLDSLAGGGRDRVLRGYRLLKKSVASPKKTSFLLTTTGGLSALAGIILIILSLFLPGILAAAAGAALFAGGIAALVQSRKNSRKLADFLAKLNFTYDPEEPGLADYIDRCYVAAGAEKQYFIALDARRGVVTVRRERLAAARAECREKLLKIGSDETDENLPAALAEAVELASAFCTAREELNLRRDNADANISALTEDLKKYNEQTLRKKAEAAPALDVMSYEDYKKSRTELIISIKAAEDKQHSIENELTELGAKNENPRRLALQLEQHENLLAEMQLKHDAVKLAGEALAEAADQLRRGVTPKLKNTASELMGQLTGGRYTQLGVGENLSVTITAGENTRPLAAMSGGTRDAAYISLRIALISLLCQKEIPPLFVDEGLSQLDDQRAENFINILSDWCSNQEGQCLLFTCQTREARLAGERAKVIRI